MVKFRQLADRLRHRIVLIPILFVIGAFVLSQVTLQIDRLGDFENLPRVLQTTVDSGRAILSAIAAGLITSVTLLLSMMLVAVQLAGSQYSPRTAREWIGDRTQQLAIGLVLGTSVYCLLILRETRTFSEGEALTPHLSVMLALVLGVASLVGVVRSVDHLTNSLRIGAVANNIMRNTVQIIERDKRLNPSEKPVLAPAARLTEAEADSSPPDGALAITARTAGWVQQIDEDALFAAAPANSTVLITAALGSFMMPEAPMAWIWPYPDSESCVDPMREAIALGDARTLQEDIGFGILQMVDIAMRALSPGINDPNTANDIIAHLGAVMLALWKRPFAPTSRVENDRKLVRHDLNHGDYLHAAFDQIRRFAAADPEVASTMIRVLKALHSETRRRDLPGPLEPIEEVIGQLMDAVTSSNLSGYDKQRVLELTT